MSTKTRPILILIAVIWMISCVAVAERFRVPTPLPLPTSSAMPTQVTTLTVAPTSTVIPPLPTEEQPTPSTGSFELVGHNPLLNRGMNAGLAVYGNYAYVGSRTDGTHADAGVLVVDISNPANPQVVYQIGPPEQGLVGQTSRELRVWHEQEILLVLNFTCEAGLHDCAQSLEPPSLGFYDISAANAAAPKLMGKHELPLTPHEFFLWDDPKMPERALVYVSVQRFIGDTVLVIDISQARQGIVHQVASWNAPRGPFRTTIHSLGLSVDGKRAYLAYLRNGFMILDTSQLADGIPSPQINLLTPPEQWILWTDPGLHSAVKLFGKPYVLVTEEVYGRCPWGWVSIIDITNESSPGVVSDYKLDPYNLDEQCSAFVADHYRLTSFAAHNPTLTKNLAFITWHSGGLQAISIEEPLQPRQVAQFLPQPLASVQTEDPVLSSGLDKVVMWSYPIIKDGLMYVVDVRNGLYILRYRGPFETEVSEIRFLEGNSNLGEAQLWDGP